MGQKNSSGKGKNSLEDELEFLASTTGLDKPSIKELYDSFSNKKGINKKEFISAYRKLNPKAVNTDQLAETLFKNCDQNKDGTICFKEFAVTIYFLTKAPKEEKLRHIFSLLDMDGNGSLSSREIVQVVKYAYDIRGGLNFDYNNKGIQIFRSMDKDGDMRVNCEEFVNACMKDPELSSLLEEMLGTIVEMKSK